MQTITLKCTALYFLLLSCLVSAVDMELYPSTFEGRGTHMYMSPEQYQKGHVDSKTDIYALGKILFELFYYSTSMDCKRRYEVNYEFIFLQLKQMVGISLRIAELLSSKWWHYMIFCLLIFVHICK